jgi:prepilin-type N-terminal cleavage/methylation domain-containing protein
MFFIEYWSMPRRPAEDKHSVRTLPKARNGFTIMEVVIVVLIIALLAAIAIPKYWGSKDRAYIAAMQADLRTASIYEEQYALENHGQYFSGVATADNPVEGFRASPGVTVTLTAAEILTSHLYSWTGTARHARSKETCEIRTGLIACSSGGDESTGLFSTRRGASTGMLASR